MDVFQRRNLLVTAANPYGRLDYVSELKGHVRLDSEAGPAAITVRYVPDRQVAGAPAFGRYLEALSGLDWCSLEALAASILDDLVNELVPRWIQVTAEVPAEGGPSPILHAVMLEDRQPRWDNKALLGRLRPF